MNTKYPVNSFAKNQDGERIRIMADLGNGIRIVSAGQQVASFQETHPHIGMTHVAQLEEHGWTEEER